MSDLLRNIIRFFVFILVQVYVLDKIPLLHRFIAPYIYFLFLLWLPFSISTHRFADHWIFYGNGIGLFYNDTRSACCRLCIDSLLPSFCNQYSYAKRFNGIQLPRTIAKGHGLDAVPGVCL